jgi:hypothetical protein
MSNRGIGGVKRIPPRSRACLWRPEKAYGKLEMQKEEQTTGGVVGDSSRGRREREAEGKSE